MESSSIFVQSPSATLRQLLDLTRADFPNNPTLSMRNFELYMAQFEKTAEYMAESVGETVNTALVCAVAGSEAHFENFLSKHPRKHNTVSRHLGRRYALLGYAKDFGLLPEGSPIELEWQPLLDAAGRNSGGVRRIVEYVQGKNLLNCDFSQAVMNVWKAQAKLDGYLDDYINRAEKAFRRAIRKGNLDKRFPLFDASKRVRPYSIFIEDMDEALKTNVMHYVTWAREQARLKLLRIGESIVTQFEAMCGYAILIRGWKDLTSVAPLLTKEFLEKYVDWLHQKGCQRPAICNRLGGIHTVVVYHPDFNTEDFSWWFGVIDRVDPEPKSVVKDRREDRSADYEDLLDIPPTMQEYRSSATNLSPAARRWFVRDQLLMALAIKMLWDPQLIRTARVNGTSPNMFKKEVPKDRPNLAFTPSAKKAWKDNQDVELWQFDFESERGVGAYGFMIKDVLPLINEYDRYRKEMIGEGKDPGTLFFTRNLKPLSRTDLNLIVGRCTDKFGPKRVTPESIRNSFIDFWLIEHPKDFIGLANILMISLESVQVRFDPDYRPDSNRGR